MNNHAIELGFICLGFVAIFGGCLSLVFRPVVLIRPKRYLWNLDNPAIADLYKAGSVHLRLRKQGRSTERHLNMMLLTGTAEFDAKIARVHRDLGAFTADQRAELARMGIR